MPLALNAALHAPEHIVAVRPRSIDASRLPHLDIVRIEDEQMSVDAADAVQ